MCIRDRFTEYRRRDEIYRVHSDYRSGGPWYDWCVVQWEDVDYETQLPNWEEGIVQILGFIEAPDGVLHAIVHPCDYNLTKVKGAIGTL